MSYLIKLPPSPYSAGTMGRILNLAAHLDSWLSWDSTTKTWTTDDKVAAERMRGAGAVVEEVAAC